MDITIIQYGGIKKHLFNVKGFEFRTNQTENWIKVKYQDGHTDMIYSVCVIKTN